MHPLSEKEMKQQLQDLENRLMREAVAPLPELTTPEQTVQLKKLSSQKKNLIDRLHSSKSREEQTQIFSEIEKTIVAEWNILDAITAKSLNK